MKNEKYLLPQKINIHITTITPILNTAEGGEGEVQLPPLKPGVVNPISHLRPVPTRPEIMTRLNTVYARDYRMVNDVKITLQSLRSWGG